MTYGTVNGPKLKRINELERFFQIFEKADHDPTPEMLHFLAGHGPFAKLARMNLKNLHDECSCGKKQTNE